MSRNGAYVSVVVQVPRKDRDAVIDFAKELRKASKDEGSGKPDEMRWTDYRRDVNQALEDAIYSASYRSNRDLADGHDVVTLDDIAFDYGRVFLPMGEEADLRRLAKTLVMLADHGVVHKTWRNGTWAYYSKTYDPSQDSD